MASLYDALNHRLWNTRYGHYSGRCGAIHEAPLLRGRSSVKAKTALRSAGDGCRGAHPHTSQSLSDLLAHASPPRRRLLEYRSVVAEVSTIFRACSFRLAMLQSKVDSRSFCSCLE
ncbi:hypothetical protein P280DRAFT_264732 [Massarina eburnea CBS 473.64]|uniref:Uncharacterized protein n=1 Tax=Massarina eburnea CBS 473.64 TaxID=1395130 RepID=A0A6A6S6Q7_9PLEO|nr:hypothetical protein P280DRAFT_264732 [Massarina eburnea CBS 473.64]